MALRLDELAAEEREILAALAFLDDEPPEEAVDRPMLDAGLRRKLRLLGGERDDLLAGQQTVERTLRFGLGRDVGG